MTKRVASVDKLLLELRARGQLNIRPVVPSKTSGKKRHNPYETGLKRYELYGGMFQADTSKVRRQKKHAWCLPPDPEPEPQQIKRFIPETTHHSIMNTSSTSGYSAQQDVDAVRKIYQNLGSTNSGVDIKSEPIDPDDVAGTSFEPEINIDIKEEPLEEVSPHMPRGVGLSDIYGEGFASSLNQNMDEYIL